MDEIPIITASLSVGTHVVTLDDKEVKTTPGKIIPPKALSLPALSKAMAAKGLPAKKTMELAQAMYDDGVISYPRTDDTFISNKKFKEMLPNLDNIIRLMGLSPEVFTHRTPRSTHVRDDIIHGALCPGINLPDSLETLNIKYGKGASSIYKMITERFLMMFLEDTEQEDENMLGKDTSKKDSLFGNTSVINDDLDHVLDDVKKEDEAESAAVKSESEENTSVDTTSSGRIQDTVADKIKEQHEIVLDCIRNMSDDVYREARKHIDNTGDFYENLFRFVADHIDILTDNTKSGILVKDDSGNDVTITPEMLSQIQYQLDVQRGKVLALQNEQHLIPDKSDDAVNDDYYYAYSKNSTD